MSDLGHTRRAILEGQTQAELGLITTIAFASD
jgi:hypothetical protein